jgi:uncharacterized protein (TIRG00374 family)
MWQGLIGAAISAAFLYWALHDVKPVQVFHEIGRAHPVWFLASVAAATLTFPLRAIRWRIFLANSTSERRVQPYWRAVAIGFMANNVLPGRAGEVVRAYAGTELIGVPFPSSLASVGIERIFDGVVLVGLLALAVAAPDFPSNVVLGRGPSLAALTTTMAALFAGALALLIVMVRSRARSLALVERIVRKVLPVRAAGPVVGILAHLADGLAVLGSTRDILRVLTWTFALWLTNAGAYVFGFWAFGIETPPGAALVLQSVVAFGVAIPSAPGFFGVFEKISRSVLGIYDIAPGRAISFAIAIHIGWFVPITVIGLVILARTGLSLRSLSGGKRPAATVAPVP